MTRFDPVAVISEKQTNNVADVRALAEELANILDRYPSRESSHAKTLLEGAVMFGVRAICVSRSE